MKRWGLYFRLEYKKMAKTLPALFAGMLLLLALICGILIFSQTVLDSNKKEFQKIRVGIVGSEEEKYTKIALTMIEKMETVQYSAEFNYCTKEEAEEGLESGKYDAIFFIPEDYVKGFMHGENKTIVARFGEGQSGIVSYIMKQLSDFASNLLIESEKNIYSMQDYYWEVEPESERQALIDINLEYMQRILARNNAFLTEKITQTDGLPLDTYYFCDAILLIFLFLGLQCARMLQKNHPDLERKLSVAGVSAVKQVFAKLLAFVITFFTIYLVFGLLLLIAMPLAEQKGIVLMEGSLLMKVQTLLKIALILLPICSFIMLIYELFEESVNGILLLFVSIVVLAFMAGCFYPLSFLPKQIQVLSQFTMTRAVFDYIAGCVSGSQFGSGLVTMLIHTVIILIVIIIIRNRRIKRSA